MEHIWSFYNEFYCKKFYPICSLMQKTIFLNKYLCIIIWQSVVNKLALPRYSIDVCHFWNHCWTSKIYLLFEKIFLIYKFIWVINYTSHLWILYVNVRKYLLYHHFCVLHNMRQQIKCSKEAHFDGVKTTFSQPLTCQLVKYDLKVNNAIRYEPVTLFCGRK